MPHVIWYITNILVRALDAPPFTPSARRSHEDPRQDGGPCENASLDDFAAHRGPLHRAACRARGGFILGAGACRACAAGRPCTVRTLPNLRRRSIRVAASNAARYAVTARKSWFFHFSRPYLAPSPMRRPAPQAAHSAPFRRRPEKPSAHIRAPRRARRPASPDRDSLPLTIARREAAQERFHVSDRLAARRVRRRPRSFARGFERLCATEFADHRHWRRQAARRRTRRRSRPVYGDSASRPRHMDANRRRRRVVDRAVSRPAAPRTRAHRRLGRLRRRQYARDSNPLRSRPARRAQGRPGRLCRKPLRPGTASFDPRLKSDARLPSARTGAAAGRHSDELRRRRRRHVSDRSQIFSRDRSYERRQRPRLWLLDARRRDQFHLAHRLYGARAEHGVARRRQLWDRARASADVAHHRQFRFSHQRHVHPCRQLQKTFDDGLHAAQRQSRLSLLQRSRNAVLFRRL